MNRPRVAVVIATYNRGPRIGPTLDTAFAQTRRPDEVVVVDDSSTDGTGDWVRSHYPAARVARTPRNLFTAAARNFGAAAATADVLVFLDHDDLLHPHAIATLLGQLAAAPEARAAFADHRYVNTATGETIPDHHRSQPAFRRLQKVAVARHTPAGRVYRRPLFHALLRGNLLQQPWAVHRDTFHRLGGFAADVRYCEDWDMYLRLTRAVPITLSDAVISDHVVEGANLHLTPNQQGMYARVLGRALRRSPLDVRVAVPVLRTLGSFAKADGDRSTGAAAWRAYLRSFALWPFDHVVAARALTGGRR